MLVLRAIDVDGFTRFACSLNNTYLKQHPEEYYEAR